MQRRIMVALLALIFAVALLPAQVSAQSNQACWGQASKVFAQTGEMGKHSAQQPTPRLGLKNLAKALYEAGVIDAPTMQALGVFVVAELGLTIEACLAGGD